MGSRVLLGTIGVTVRAPLRKSEGLIVNPKSWNPDKGQIVLGFPIHYA